MGWFTMAKVERLKMGERGHVILDGEVVGRVVERGPGQWSFEFVRRGFLLIPEVEAGETWVSLSVAFEALKARIEARA